MSGKDERPLSGFEKWLLEGLLKIIEETKDMFTKYLFPEEEDNCIREDIR